MDTSQTMVCFEEPRNFFKNQLSSLVPLRKTSFIQNFVKLRYSCTFSA